MVTNIEIRKSPGGKWYVRVGRFVRLEPTREAAIRYATRCIRMIV